MKFLSFSSVECYNSAPSKQCVSPRDLPQFKCNDTMTRPSATIQSSDNTQSIVIHNGQHTSVSVIKHSSNTSVSTNTDKILTTHCLLRVLHTNVVHAASRPRRHNTNKQDNLFQGSPTPHIRGAQKTCTPLLDLLPRSTTAEPKKNNQPRIPHHSVTEIIHSSYLTC